ncbi:MAG: hypothetical protein IKK38_13870 [Spirochaetaceae bacterium]|nr:hypothetical protein [Spirochaetaceae bacterium]
MIGEKGQQHFFSKGKNRLFRGCNPMLSYEANFSLDGKKPPASATDTAQRATEKLQCNYSLLQAILQERILNGT